LNTQLKAAGIPECINGKKLSPVDALVSGGLSSKPYQDIILTHFDSFSIEEKTWAARMLSEKGLIAAVPYLLSVFHEYTGQKIDLWAVGNALSIIDDPQSYNEILIICKDSKYGHARQMLMSTLAKMKTEEAYSVLLDCLFDDSVRGHAIEALGKFGDIRALNILESLDVKRGYFEFKAKETAIKRLKKKEKL
jgi:FOG: HEAT repeat